MENFPKSGAKYKGEGGGGASKKFLLKMLFSLISVNTSQCWVYLL